ncbi:unnamed protein product [Phytophthora fragariaefolia]|uniref:Unnamed protein product n=1 Tax=Phytophthora fragariaefolia TaxID=1490495 RepID=A0A9W6TXI7_9STRA|nr:unnamed protein product [Phytophthora fragariaefolia]
MSHSKRPRTPRPSTFRTQNVPSWCRLSSTGRQSAPYVVVSCLLLQTALRSAPRPSAVSGAGPWVTSNVPGCTHCPQECPTLGADVKLRQPAGAAPPAGDAVERVDIGHAVSKTAAPSHSHCKKKDDKPNLVILKVNSKRERGLFEHQWIVARQTTLFDCRA